MPRDDLAEALIDTDGMALNNNILETNNWSILPIIEKVSQDYGLGFSSCLDVGSGLRPKTDWFLRNYGEAHDARFASIEANPKIIKQLEQREIITYQSFDSVGAGQFDLSLALEVIEHVKLSELPHFMSELERVTRKAVAITVPNFEFLTENFRMLPAYKEVRWVPDHVNAWDPESDNPHKHKHMTTPDSIRRLFERHFPQNRWSVGVMRAWPWRLQDVAKKKEWTLFFKVFAIAVRHDAWRV